MGVEVGAWVDKTVGVTDGVGNGVEDGVAGNVGDGVEDEVGDAVAGNVGDAVDVSEYVMTSCGPLTASSRDENRALNPLTENFTP